MLRCLIFLTFFHSVSVAVDFYSAIRAADLSFLSCDTVFVGFFFSLQCVEVSSQYNLNVKLLPVKPRCLHIAVL